MKNKMIMFRLLTVFTPVVLYTSIYTVYNLMKRLGTELNRMNTGISTINSEISNIKRDITTLTGLDLSEYQKKSTLETDVKAIINPQLTTLESNVKTSVETSVNSSISGTLSSLETKINGKIGSDIASSETKIKDEINISLSSTLSGYVTNTLYNQDKVTYSTLNGTNNFTGNNEFTNKVNFVSGIKVNGVDIDFNNLGGGSGSVDTSNFVTKQKLEEVVATIPKIVMLTQSEYDLLPVKDEKTMYLIKEV